MTTAAGLPTSQDDPRLANWYHTIELGDGLASTGFYDHRTVVDRYGLPRSLEGLSALDVGTADGFFAFEMERRGAERVVAIDIARQSDFDYLPAIRARLGDTGERSCQFPLAAAMRGSRVDHRICSVYDLDPDAVGTFDVVFCGSLLLHLQNPVRALSNIRSVTRELAVIETMIEPELDAEHPGRPWLHFGHREHERELGEACIYWRMSTTALEEMLHYVGFEYTEPTAPFALPPGGLPVRAVRAYPTRPVWAKDTLPAMPQVWRTAERLAATEARLTNVEIALATLSQSVQPDASSMIAPAPAVAPMEPTGEQQLLTRLAAAEAALDAAMRSRSWRALGPARAVAGLARSARDRRTRRADGQA